MPNSSVVGINISPLAATTTSTSVTFNVTSNGSILTSSGINNIAIGSYTTADKSFKISYRTKDGINKTETVTAITLEEAISKIKDLDVINYHIID